MELAEVDLIIADKVKWQPVHSEIISLLPPLIYNNAAKLTLA